METEEQLTLKLRILEAVEQYLEIGYVEDFQVHEDRDRQAIRSLGSDVINYVPGRINKTRIVIELS